MQMVLHLEGCRFMGWAIAALLLEAFDVLLQLDRDALLLTELLPLERVCLSCHFHYLFDHYGRTPYFE